MMRLTPSSGAPLSRSTTSMVISWSGAATVRTGMLSAPGECAIPSLGPANSSVQWCEPMSSGATAWTSAYWSAPDPGQIAPGSLPDATMVLPSSRTGKAAPSSVQPLEHFMPTWNLKASPAVIADGRSHALRWTSWALTVQRASALAPAWATSSSAAGISTMLYPYSPSSIGAVTV